MRCAQFPALSGEDSSAFANEELGSVTKPFGSYRPRGTMTSQQSRTWPPPSSSPQPSPCDSMLVSASNCWLPVPSLPVTVSCTSCVWNWLNDLLMLVSYSVESGSPGVESAGTKGIEKRVLSQLGP